MADGLWLIGLLLAVLILFGLTWSLWGTTRRREKHPLRHRSADVRCEAARKLGEEGDKSALPLLLAALRDEDEMVRVAACGALVSEGFGVAALAPAIEMLCDDDPELRCAAKNVLQAGDFVYRAIPAAVEAYTRHPGDVARSRLKAWVSSLPGCVRERALKGQPESIRDAARRMQGDECWA